MNYSVPVSMVRQYCFCPRIPYYHLLSNVKPIYPSWVEQGTTYHKKQKKVFDRRTLIRFNLDDAKIYYDYFMELETEGIHGNADMILVSKNEVFPVEFKMSENKTKKNKPYRGQLLQLVAYGLLAEKHFNLKCKKGFLLFGKKGKTIPIEITDKLKQEVKKIVYSIQEMMTTQTFPDSAAKDTQCGLCEYLNFCNDRGFE